MAGDVEGDTASYFVFECVQTYPPGHHLARVVYSCRVVKEDCEALDRHLGVVEEVIIFCSELRIKQTSNCATNSTRADNI